MHRNCTHLVGVTMVQLKHRSTHRAPTAPQRTHAFMTPPNAFGQPVAARLRPTLCPTSPRRCKEGRLCL